MRITIVMLAVLPLMGCQQPISQKQHVEATSSLPAEVVRRCPNGHTTIKLVPITYGMIAMTPELREKEANNEVAFGGCDMNSMGKFKIVCTTCGAHTYEGGFPWYDKTTRVIPQGDSIKGPGMAEQSPGGDSLKAAHQE